MTDAQGQALRIEHCFRELKQAKVAEGHLKVHGLLLEELEGYVGDLVTALAAVQRQGEQTRGVAFCSFCGWSEQYDNTDSGAQSHAAAMLAVHVQGCKEHPLMKRAITAEARVTELEQERNEARADAESWQANYDSCNRERRQLHDLVHELRMATTKDEAWAILTRPNVLPMQQAAEAAEQTRQALSTYVQHKPECETLTKRAEYVTCPYCKGTGRATDSKHQMKMADGTPWPQNNCAPCAGNPDHQWVRYPECTCGLSTLLLGGGTAREERP